MYLWLHGSLGQGHCVFVGWDATPHPKHIASLSRATSNIQAWAFTAAGWPLIKCEDWAGSIIDLFMVVTVERYWDTSWQYEDGQKSHQVEQKINGMQQVQKHTVVSWSNWRRKEIWQTTTLLSQNRKPVTHNTSYLAMMSGPNLGLERIDDLGVTLDQSMNYF